jgi:hypothetical protein
LTESSSARLVTERRDLLRQRADASPGSFVFVYQSVDEILVMR